MQVSPIDPVVDDDIDQREAADLAEMFRLLGDPTRVRILATLAAHEELCVGDIAELVDSSDTKVSQGLRLMRGAGVLRTRRAGRRIYYRLDDDHVRTLVSVSRRHIAHARGAR